MNDDGRAMRLLPTRIAERVIMSLRDMAPKAFWERIDRVLGDLEGSHWTYDFIKPLRAELKWRFEQVGEEVVVVPRAEYIAAHPPCPKCGAMRGITDPGKAEYPCPACYASRPGAPSGYEHVGEWRQPLFGESYLGGDGKAHVWDSDNYWRGDHELRWILRKVDSSPVCNCQDCRWEGTGNPPCPPFVDGVRICSSWECKPSRPKYGDMLHAAIVKALKELGNFSPVDQSPVANAFAILNSAATAVEPAGEPEPERDEDMSCWGCLWRTHENSGCPAAFCVGKDGCGARESHVKKGTGPDDPEILCPAPSVSKVRICPAAQQPQRMPASEAPA